jgi:hypothetical protein
LPQSRIERLQKELFFRKRGMMIKFSDERKKWEAWTQEYEMTALEILWVKKEIDLQDEVRRSAASPMS